MENLAEEVSNHGEYQKQSWFSYSWVW